MPVGRFICGVGALIRDPDTQKYLILRRSTQKDVGAGQWECPTGRVDQGEGFQEALVREVMEELGVSITPDFILGTTHFYRGAQIQENELVGLLYACSLSEKAAVQIGEEHDAYRWLSAGEIDEFLAPEHWLHWCIRRERLMRQGVTEALLAVFLDEGFELGGLNGG
jgi:8-oxo-dGTP diphosphatase